MSRTWSEKSIYLALPFWCSLALIPLVWGAAIWGGMAFFLVFLATWLLFPFLDLIFGLNLENENTDKDLSSLFWYKLLLLCWPTLQFFTIFGLIYYACSSEFSKLESIGLFLAVGAISGIVGINYSHELMHNSGRIERRLSDFLLGMVLYSHFRSEHLLVHHRYVGTPRDGVTAKYDESFYEFLFRVIPTCLASAFNAEIQKLKRKNLRWYDFKNPFYLYLFLQLSFAALAYALGGSWGIILFFWQAFVAVFHLELVNYIEHYGLTRKYLGNGKYEHTKPHHSWNAAQKATNWLLINLQRHSDHHYNPNRPFPLLQNFGATEAPQLPYGYGVIGIWALFPKTWRRKMNPRVLKWREMYYPEIQDWGAYNNGSSPSQRGT